MSIALAVSVEKARIAKNIEKVKYVKQRLENDTMQVINGGSGDY